MKEHGEGDIQRASLFTTVQDATSGQNRFERNILLEYGIRKSERRTNTEIIAIVIYVPGQNVNFCYG
jgi:hypothetical protein